MELQTRNNLLKEAAILKRMLENKLNIQDRLVVTFKEDFEELRTIYIFDEGILITSSIIDLVYTGDMVKIKETYNDGIANAMLKNTIQRKAEVEEHTRKAKAILQEILKCMEVYEWKN